MLPLAILSSLLVSCASPPDVPSCAPITEDIGYCIFSISDKEFYVDNNARGMDDKGNACVWKEPLVVNGVPEKTNCMQWKDLKKKSLIVPAQSYGKIKKFIIDICKQHNQCNKDIRSWERKADKITAVPGSAPAGQQAPSP